MKKMLRAVRDKLDRYNFLPVFTEDSIFLMVVALGMVYVVDPSAQTVLLGILLYSKKLTVMVALGIIFTLYTAFFTRFKTETQKHYMIWFAIIVNVVVGIAAFNSLAAAGSPRLLYLFPALNVFTFIVVVIFWHAGLYTTGRLATRSNTYSNIFYGSLVVGAITFIYEFVPHSTWQVVFSTSISYATFFSAKISKYLPRIFPREGDRTEEMQRLIDAATERALSLINDMSMSEGHLVVATDEGVTVHTLPLASEKESVDYLDTLLNTTCAGKVAAIASLGMLTWKQAWWSREKTSPSVDVNVFLPDETKTYEFSQTLEEDHGKFIVDDRGLVYFGTRERR